MISSSERDTKTNGLDTKRPYFGPRQIRTLRGLYPGQIIIEFWEGHGAQKLLKIRKMLPRENAVLVEEINANNDDPYISKLFLSDHSVTHYDARDDGSILWNNWWCFLRTRAKTTKGLCQTKQKNLIREKTKRSRNFALSWVQDIEPNKAVDLITKLNAKIKTGEIKAPEASKYKIGLSKNKVGKVGIYFFDPTGR